MNAAECLRVFMSTPSLLGTGAVLQYSSPKWLEVLFSHSVLLTSHAKPYRNLASKATTLRRNLSICTKSLHILIVTMALLFGFGNLIYGTPTSRPCKHRALANVVAQSSFSSSTPSPSSPKTASWQEVGHTSLTAHLFVFPSV